jgi:peptide/nickel transport system permease protein
MTNILSNLLPCAILALLIYSIVSAGKTPLWAEAYRRLRRNRIAMAALLVIALYGGVAFLDSVGTTDKDGTRQSLIDRWFQRPQERYYSAPLATTTTGEPKPHKLNERHLLGTDAIGNDVLYKTLKGCRTAIIIGGMTLLISTPLALLFGIIAGYFGKRVDDAVQFVYTVLDSIPGILLLISILMVLGNGLWQLCVAMGITSWVGLCRLARAETLKHRDREYVRAARALGAGPGRIMFRHILPNLLPIVIITTTLGFSGLVMQEAILSFLQLGVGEGTGSWGNMIDGARLELAREPAIWWNLASASTAMFILVLAFNLFGDALRDAIDPRLRS